MERFDFPEGFLWGAATSAHQVEGGTHNDWSEWEKMNAERLARKAEARYAHWMPSWPLVKSEAESPANYISGKAADHYNRFRADFDIAKFLGHNAHRFSIEWSRIEPEKGKFNEKEIEHYRRIIKALRERGIEPFVTLWHWTNPVWVSEQGGWVNSKTVDDYIGYVEFAVGHLKNDVTFWMPLNEPNVYVGHGYVTGLFPPQRKNLFMANRVFKNLMRGYRGAYLAIKDIDSNAKVGISHNAIYHVPWRDRWFHRAAASIVDHIRNRRFIGAVRDVTDFIGIQYYFRDTITLSLGGRWKIVDVKNPNEWVSDMGWEIYPEGIYHAVKAAARYGKPIYITENGVADKRDIHRTRFIKDHLQWLAKAMAEGADVRGYFHWSLMDNFEWDKGFWPRFGLVEVDYKTLAREIRPSALEYQKIILANSIWL